MTLCAEWMMKTPRVGAHYEVDFQDYRRWAAFNASAAKHARKSMAHVKAAWEADDDPSKYSSAQKDSRAIGSALHCLLLEGIDEFHSRFVVGPCDDKRSKAWRDFEKSVQSVNTTLLREKDGARVVRMAGAVLNHDRAGKLIDAIDVAEVSCVWNERTEYEDVLCKARFDAVAEKLGCVVDIKTTAETVEDRVFERHMLDFGYGLQAGAYMRAAHACLDWDVPATEFVFVQVETEPPYDVVVRVVDEQSIQIGMLLWRDAVQAWARCEAEQSWPGRSFATIPARYPEWFLSQMWSERASDLPEVMEIAPSAVDGAA